jgi:hypothetical protein
MLMRHTARYFLYSKDDFNTFFGLLMHHQNMTRDVMNGNITHKLGNYRTPFD